jgi:hypothetical protein
MERFDDDDSAERRGVTGHSDEQRRSIRLTVELTGDDVLLLDVPRIREGPGR